MSFDISGKRVFVAGHRGLAGSALIRRLARENCTLLTAGREMLDLTDRPAVENWLRAHRPQAVIVAAAKVGGILPNSRKPADFLYQNLAIELTLIHAAFALGVEKLLFLGSSCIYPRDARQPIAEEALLTGPLEATNEAYALAKIAGVKLCQAYRRQHGCDFIAAMPSNLYGPGDNFHPENAHVPAALLRRFHEAKLEGRDRVTVWGTGRPRREFLFVDDLADACVFLMRNYSGEVPLNVGAGTDIAIADFAKLIAEVTGFKGAIMFDSSYPDGTPRKLLDVSKLSALGWRARTPLHEGLEQTYAWFVSHPREARAA